MTLTEFLLARIADDEAAAHNAAEGPWDTWRIDGTQALGVYSVPRLPGNRGVIAIADRRDYDAYEHRDSTEAMDPGDARHIARWNPARVLAECEAKRRIVAVCEPQLGSGGGHDEEAVLANSVLRALADPYADHPNYQQEWRP